MTIDPATARDFDDAISLSRDDRGYWSLGVHIADVAHFVRSARPSTRPRGMRGTSVYLPDRVIPMLPGSPLEQPGEPPGRPTRYTMSAFIEFNAEGVRTDHRFARSAIRVDHRFSLRAGLRGDEGSRGAASRGSPRRSSRMLGRMLELAMILRRRRFQRGALELNMPEIEIDLGEQGEVVGAHLASHDESHQVIEEFMLAANEAVATAPDRARASASSAAATPTRSRRSSRSSPSSPAASASRSRSRRAGSSYSSSSPKRPTSPRRTRSTTGSCGA